MTFFFYVNWWDFENHVVGHVWDRFSWIVKENTPKKLMCTRMKRNSRWLHGNFASHSFLKECWIMQIGNTVKKLWTVWISLQAAVALGQPLATFPNAPQFRLSALPSLEKEKLLEDRSGISCRFCSKVILAFDFKHSIT